MFLPVSFDFCKKVANSTNQKNILSFPEMTKKWKKHKPTNSNCMQHCWITTHTHLRHFQALKYLNTWAHWPSEAAPSCCSHWPHGNLIWASSGPGAACGQLRHARAADSEDRPAAAPGTQSGDPFHQQGSFPGPSVPCHSQGALRAWILQSGDGFGWNGLTSSSLPLAPLGPRWL